MEESILISVKQVLGLEAEDSGFDQEIIEYVNGALAIAQQLGATEDVVQIEDDTATWSDMNISSGYLSLLRSYIFLKVQSLWDPPTLSFLITLKNEQLAEYETRLNMFSEVGPHGH